MITHLLDTCVYSQRLRPKPLVSVMDRWKDLGAQTNIRVVTDPDSPEGYREISNQAEPVGIAAELAV